MTSRTSEINSLTATYEGQYVVAKDLTKGGPKHQSLRDAARIELGLRTFLEKGNLKHSQPRLRTSMVCPSCPALQCSA